jgi:AraC-like DNA-binding protein
MPSCESNVVTDDDDCLVGANGAERQVLSEDPRCTATLAPPVRLPLARFPVVHTSSFDEALYLQSSINASVLRAELSDRRTPFEWRANGFAAGPITLLVGQYGAGVRGHAADLSARYSLAIPISGAGQITQHDQAGALIPGRRAAMCSPSMPAGFSLDSGYHGIHVVIQDRVLESALDTLTGVSRKTPLCFEVGVDLERAGAASALRLLDFMLSEAERDGSALNAPLLASQLAETFVHSLLFGFPHNHSQLLHSPAPKVDPAHLRRAEEFIVAHARDAITMAEVAAAAGVSAGTLFAAFRAYRGCSPMAFLRARRFDLARARLRSVPAATVAEVALACGFEHLGRFSVQYRKRFGESPRETLQRTRATK